MLPNIDLELTFEKRQRVLSALSRRFAVPQRRSSLFRGSGGHLATDASAPRSWSRHCATFRRKYVAGDRVALIGDKRRGQNDAVCASWPESMEPISGTVTSCGRISPMLDVGLGIDNEISGYENIRMRGLILGMSPQEIEAQMQDIADFTDLGRLSPHSDANLFLGYDGPAYIRRCDLFCAGNPADG